MAATVLINSFSYAYLNTYRDNDLHQEWGIRKFVTSNKL